MSLTETIAFWFTLVNLLLLVALFLRRRIYRELPFFFLFIVYDLLAGGARFAASFGHPKLSFYVFWFTEFAGFFVVVLALYEVSLKRLFPAFFRFRFYRVLFPLMAIIIPTLSIQIALQASDRNAALLMAMRGYDAARSIVLVFVVALMMFMGRTWRRYDFGILFGFSVQGAAAVLNGIARTRIHYQPKIWNNVEALAFCITCFIWLITFLKPEEHVELQPLDQMAAETLHQARTWRTALKEWLAPGKRSGQV